MNMKTNNANRASSHSGGFTLIELLVVIGIIAVLAAILLPALAAAKRRSLRAQDIDNLKEQMEGSIMYAGDFNDWYPVSDIGAANAGGTVNNLNGIFYCYFIEYNAEWGPSSSGVGPQVLTANEQILPGFKAYNQNQGLLYGGNYCGNPNIFFCPALQDTHFAAG